MATYTYKHYTYNKSTPCATWYMEVNESEVNQSNNTSKITVKFYVKATHNKTKSDTYNNYPAGYGSSTPYSKFYIDGVCVKTVNPACFDCRYNSSKKIAHGTTYDLGTYSKVITHNSDGKKSVTVTCLHYTSVSPGEVKLTTGSMALTPIQRDRTTWLTVPGGTHNIGNNITIQANPSSTSLTHALNVSLDNANWVNIQNGLTFGKANAANNYTFTIPNSFKNTIPARSGGTMYVKLSTWRSGSYIGVETKTVSIYNNDNLGSGTFTFDSSMSSEFKSGSSRLITNLYTQWEYMPYSVGYEITGPNGYHYSKGYSVDYERGIADNSGDWYILWKDQPRGSGSHKYYSPVLPYPGTYSITVTVNTGRATIDMWKFQKTISYTFKEAATTLNIKEFYVDTANSYLDKGKLVAGKSNPRLYVGYYTNKSIKSIKFDISGANSLSYTMSNPSYGSPGSYYASVNMGKVTKTGNNTAKVTITATDGKTASTTFSFTTYEEEKYLSIQDSYIDTTLAKDMVNGTYYKGHSRLGLRIKINHSHSLKSLTAVIGSKTYDLKSYMYDNAAYTCPDKFTKAGNTTISLTVKDVNGLTNTKTMTVFVDEEVEPPTVPKIEFEHKSDNYIFLSEGEKITFTGRSTDLADYQIIYVLSSCDVFKATEIYTSSNSYNDADRSQMDSRLRSNATGALRYHIFKDFGETNAPITQDSSVKNKFHLHPTSPGHTTNDKYYALQWFSRANPGDLLYIYVRERIKKEIPSSSTTTSNQYVVKKNGITIGSLFIGNMVVKDTAGNVVFTGNGILSPNTVIGNMTVAGSKGNTTLNGIMNNGNLIAGNSTIDMDELIYMTNNYFKTTTRKYCLINEDLSIELDASNEDYKYSIKISASGKDNTWSAVDSTYTGAIQKKNNRYIHVEHIRLSDMASVVNTYGGACVFIKIEGRRNGVLIGSTVHVINLLKVSSSNTNTSNTAHQYLYSDSYNYDNIPKNKLFAMCVIPPAPGSIQIYEKLRTSDKYIIQYKNPIYSMNLGSKDPIHLIDVCLVAHDSKGNVLNTSNQKRRDALNGKTWMNYSDRKWHNIVPNSLSKTNNKEIFEMEFDISKYPAGSSISVIAFYYPDYYIHPSIYSTSNVLRTSRQTLKLDLSFLNPVNNSASMSANPEIKLRVTPTSINSADETEPLYTINHASSWSATDWQKNPIWFRNPRSQDSQYPNFRKADVYAANNYYTINSDYPNHKVEHYKAQETVYKTDMFSLTNAKTKGQGIYKDNRLYLKLEQNIVDLGDIYTDILLNKQYQDYTWLQPEGKFLKLGENKIQAYTCPYKYGEIFAEIDEISGYWLSDNIFISHSIMPYNYFRGSIIRPTSESDWSSVSSDILEVKIPYKKLVAGNNYSITFTSNANNGFKYDEDISYQVKNSDETNDLICNSYLFTEMIYEASSLTNVSYEKKYTVYRPKYSILETEVSRSLINNYEKAIDHTITFKAPSNTDKYTDEDMFSVLLSVRGIDRMTISNMKLRNLTKSTSEYLTSNQEIDTQVQENTKTITVHYVGHSFDFNYINPLYHDEHISLREYLMGVASQYDLKLTPPWREIENDVDYLMARDYNDIKDFCYTLFSTIKRNNSVGYKGNPEEFKSLPTIKPGDKRGPTTQSKTYFPEWDDLVDVIKRQTMGVEEPKPEVKPTPPPAVPTPPPPDTTNNLTITSYKIEGEQTIGRTELVYVEDKATVDLIVSTSKPISKVVLDITGENAQVVQQAGSGSSTGTLHFTMKVSPITGQNCFKVTVYDINGKTATAMAFVKSYSSEQVTPQLGNPPQITIMVHKVSNYNYNIELAFSCRHSKQYITNIITDVKSTAGFSKRITSTVSPKATSVFSRLIEIGQLPTAATTYTVTCRILYEEYGVSAETFISTIIYTNK